MNRLQQLRYDAGLSVEALAELSGVKPRTIRELESGRVRTPRVETVAPLAQANWFLLMRRRHDRLGVCG